MSLSEDIKYTADHEWAQLNGDILTIGITDFAQSELGDIIFVEFPEIGDTFFANDVFGTIEAVKTVADLFAPVTGKVFEINEALEDNPDLMNSDVYGKGWIVKITCTNASELDDLLDSEKYKEMIN